MSKELHTILEALSTFNGKFDPQKKLEVDKIKVIFYEAGKMNIIKNMLAGWAKALIELGLLLIKYSARLSYKPYAELNALS